MIAVSYEVKELGNDHARYAVSELTAGYAKLATTPQGECLAVGDEILLIKMGGEGSTAETTGQNEFLKVGGIDGNTLYFQSAKEYYYGSAADSDSGIGVGIHDQHVQIVRVPHYADLTVNGTLTGKAWDGTSGGVMVIRVSGILSGSGVIEMNGNGYLGGNGCGESISGTDCGTGGGQKGGTRSERMPKGGGGAHTTNGAAGTKGGDGLGGVAYATFASDRLYPGSAGGKGGCLSEVDGTTCGGIGGNGGGVITILANEVNMTDGVISSLGEGGDTASGSGAGGSIRVVGENISLSQALVAGGLRNIAGGDGHARAIFRGSVTSGVFGSELDLDGLTSTPGPTPTPTAVPTIDPATAVWHSRTYNYGNGHPNRITDTTDGDAYTYDANGNQVTRLVDGVSSTLTYNAENRLTSVTVNGAGESYLYDGDGVRVGRVRAGEATYLFMGGMYEITLTIPDATVIDTKSYYTAAGQVFAVRDPNGLNVILIDHLGSVVGVVDGPGALVSEQRYLPFGQVRTDLSGITVTDLSFTGQRSLTGTGLLDYKARQYDPSLRSFIQADSFIPNPYDVQDWNRYAYVHGNPVRYTDPSGNRCFPVEECVGPAGQGEPSAIMPSKLTPKSPNTPYSGEMMWEVYMKPWEDKGGFLSVTTFVTYMLAHEFQPLSHMPETFVQDLKTAASNWFWCSPNGETGNCTNLRKNGGASAEAMLNWVGAMESARKQYDDIYLKNENVWSSLIAESNYPLAFTVMNFIKNDMGATGGLLLHQPFYWANLTLPLGEQIINATQGFGITQFINSFGFKKQNPFYILTPCQTYYWRGQADMNCKPLN